MQYDVKTVECFFFNDMMMHEREDFGIILLNMCTDYIVVGLIITLLTEIVA